MKELCIYTVTHNQYHVFDASGQLPFSIVFGLCRRQSTDTDTRPIVLHTANSSLDVPYALAHGLLMLREHHEEGGGRKTLVDLAGRLSLSESSNVGTYLTLSSPVNRAQHWKEAMTIYHYRIDSTSELASMLQPGKKYTIRMASKDLAVKWWAYSNNQLPDKSTITTLDTAKLISKPSTGRASFTVVPELPHPPKVEMHMRIHPTNENPNTLEISLLNPTPQPITIQTRGPQRYLVPWGPFEPEQAEDLGVSRPRIVDTVSPAPISSLRLVDAGTGDVVREFRKQVGGCMGVTSGNIDRRPRMDTLVTLGSGELLVRRVDVGRLVCGVADGVYCIVMEPRGVWWCFGSCGEIADEDGGGRVARGVYRTGILPLVLGTEDVVEVRVGNGRIVG